MTVPPSSSNSMQICLRLFREIKIYNNIHSWYIYTSCEKIRTYQASTIPFSEVMKYFVSLVLLHFCVDKVAWVI